MSALRMPDLASATDIGSVMPISWATGRAALVSTRCRQASGRGAERYRWTHQYRGPYGYGNPIQQAVVDDAVRSWAWTPTSAVNGYRYGVYDPIEGVGTPFFAGYYSAGTRDAEDGPGADFRQPYQLSR